MWQWNNDWLLNAQILLLLKVDGYAAMKIMLWSNKTFWELKLRRHGCENSGNQPSFYGKENKYKKESVRDSTCQASAQSELRKLKKIEKRKKFHESSLVHKVLPC